MDNPDKADMPDSIPLTEIIGDLLKASRLAVLATEGNGQPHASLIAITPVHGIGQMIFATYRNTRKFKNLLMTTFCKLHNI